MDKHTKKPGEKIRGKILEFLRENEILIVPVTLREIGDAVGIEHPSVTHYHLKKLEKDKKIKRQGGRFRFIKLVKHDKQTKTTENETT
jgi:SOS-response transcriptional repressor LexA